MIKKKIHSQLIGSSFAIGILSLSVGLTSCSDLLDTDSELVEFQEDNRLNQATDSVYSVMGIIYKMQDIADRTLLLGEMRADLVSPTEHASADLKDVAANRVGLSNAYNQISDYYAVINNCNYYLANIDTTLTKRGRKVFESEYAAVKAFRAWTYLQLALVYGSVPLVTQPLLTEKAAQEALLMPPSSLKEICNYFIDDIKPYVDTKLPQYGLANSQKYFIPVRALLGDLCLWADRYPEAAAFYHDYLTLRTSPVVTGVARVRWNSQTTEFRNVLNGYSSSLVSASDAECLCFLPMESSQFNGVYSQLTNIYSSTLSNNYYAQAEPSKALLRLSASQDYCMEYKVSDSKTDTLYAPKENLLALYQEGDLRLYATYRQQIVNQDQNSKYASQRQTVTKLNTSGLTLYRRGTVYLRFAEALNRAGYPQSAFAVLKYGLYQQSIVEHVDSVERAQAADLLAFDANTFTENNTLGIHARGCGDVRADNLYALPVPAEPLASRADTVAWQQPLVEDLIVSEMALETAFEGQRFYDLMRVALRRSDPSYLADAVARRGGSLDTELHTLLLNTSNWYLQK